MICNPIRMGRWSELLVACGRQSDEVKREADANDTSGELGSEFPGSQTQARPRISGMSHVAERPHNIYESAVFIRDNLKVKGISIREEEDVELITIKLCNAIIQSVEKPPNKQFILPPIATSLMSKSEISTVTYLMGTLNNRN